MERKKLGIIAAVIAAILAAVFLPGFSELHKLREENANIKEDILALTEKNKTLEEEIQSLKEDPEHIEAKAREKLGIVKKGEYIYKSSD